MNNNEQGFHNKKTNKLLSLFLCTAKIGAFTFGGGYAMIPLMQEEFVRKKCWLKEEEMVEVLAVVGAVPGVIAVNSSIFIGYKVAGLSGSIVAAVGIALPSFAIIALLSSFYLAFKSNSIVLGALFGIRAAVVALILSAVLKLSKSSVKDAFSWIVALTGFTAVAFLKVNPFFVIIAAGLVGFIYSKLAESRLK